MFVSNIPRRKICEELLIFEEGILEINRMIYSQENLENYQKEFPIYIEKIENAYKNIKSLLIMFFENKMFESDENFEKELSYYFNNQNEVNQLIKKNKNLKKSFYENCLEIEKMFQNITVPNLTKFLLILDKFNSTIPKILEIRRDNMR